MPSLQLPDNLDELKRLLLGLYEKSEQQEKEIADLKARLQEVLEQLKLSQSKRFGRRSEKEPKGTFNEAEQQKKSKPQHHKKGRKKLPEHLKREERKYTLEDHCVPVVVK